jgi:aspartate aminotransferase-like enzyme
VEAVLARIKSTRPGFLALTHVESSTGLLFPLKELLDGLPSERPVVIVDGISSVGVEDLEADRWGIDVVVGASQKALMAPPGLGFVSMSARAQELAKKRRRSLYYFDMKRYESERARGMTPFTPAIQVMQIVHGSLIKLRGLGFQSARERHRKASSAFLSAAEHLSLVCFSESPSSSVQVLTVPERCRVDVQAELLEKGFIVAGGQGHLSGKVIRTGFLGALSSETLLRFVEELALIMKKGGCRSDSAAASHALASRYDFGYLF